MNTKIPIYKTLSQLLKDISKLILYIEKRNYKKAAYLVEGMQYSIEDLQINVKKVFEQFLGGDK